jgi:transcriptional regulator with XRE-family HTH domain
MVDLPVTHRRGGPLLNAALIRDRRQQLLLSERGLADVLGVTGSVIYGLERGANHDEQPLSLVVKLAQALALPFDDLLQSGQSGHLDAAPGDRNDPAPSRSPDGNPSDKTRQDPDGDGAANPTATTEKDAATVGALLANDRRLTPLTALAHSCGWTLDRVQTAVDHLDGQLLACGQRLHQLQGDVQVVPAVTDITTQETLGRTVIGGRGLSLPQAQLLHRIVTGEHVKPAGNAERVVLAALLNTGLVRDPAGDRRGGIPTLSPDVTFSLLG